MKTNARLLTNARALRKEMTDQERRLWYGFLRPHPLKWYKQKPIGFYIVDFYCRAAQLVVELDGGQHYEEPGRAADQARDAELARLGLTVLRFSNLDIDNNFDGVCQAIDMAVKSQSTLNSEESICSTTFTSKAPGKIT